MRERRARRAGRIRRIAAPLALIAPLVAMPLGSREIVDRAATRLGGAMSALCAFFPEPEPPAPVDADLGIGDVGSFPLPYARWTSDEDGAAVPKRHPIRGERRGFLIREDVVARAVARGARPTGSTVAASESHPAGVMIHGVDGCGSALHDGDIITHVGGVATGSEGAVVGLVAGAVTSGARAVYGVIWRGGRAIDVAVEIPLPR